MGPRVFLALTPTPGAGRQTLRGSECVTFDYGRASAGNWSWLLECPRMLVTHTRLRAACSVRISILRSARELQPAAAAAVAVTSPPAAADAPHAVI